jgi:hypothetical protein
MGVLGNRIGKDQYLWVVGHNRKANAIERATPFVVARKICSDGLVNQYSERLTPSLATLAGLALIAPALFLVFFLINLWLALVAGILSYLLIVAVLIGTAPVLSVADGSFRAGRAVIPLSIIGGATAFTGNGAFLQRGASLDARAWLCLRGWIDPVVRIELTDPEDPTPYWLVSTRRPAQLIAALTAPSAP